MSLCRKGKGITVYSSLFFFIGCHKQSVTLYIFVDNDHHPHSFFFLYSKNVVLNYTEMEAKVHEATNNEAWGASSTVMQEIAQATFN